MSLVRHGINSFGGDEFYWDETWELGGPIGGWRWGNSVVAENGWGERRYYNLCAGCRKGFWHPTLITIHQPAICPRCARKAQADETDAHAEMQSQFKAYFIAEASGLDACVMFAAVWSHLQMCSECRTAYAEFKVEILR